MKGVGKREGGSSEIVHTSEKKLKAVESQSESEDVCARLVFFFRVYSGIDLQHVYVADLRHGGCPTITRLEDNNWVGRKNYVGLGSTIYRMGGERELNGRYPTDVFLCNYSPGEPLTWKKGTPALAGKPNALVVPVNGKIYAIAGFGIHELSPQLSNIFNRHGRTDPVFEVYDPVSDKWEALEDPPFVSLYSAGYCGPEFFSHTVIDDTIYLKLLECPIPWDSEGDFPSILYYYDTKYNLWGMHTGDEMNVISPDYVVNENLRLCPWKSHASVVDNKIFLFVFPDIDLGEMEKGLALDLSSKPSKVDLSSDDNDWDPDPEADNYWLLPVVHPVMGLRAVTDEIPDDRRSSGFVTHIADNMFALVAVFNNPSVDDDTCLRVCTFEVSENPQGSPGENDSPYYPTYPKLLYAKTVNFKDVLLAPHSDIYTYKWCQTLGPSSSSSFAQSSHTFVDRPFL